MCGKLVLKFWIFVVIINLVFLCAHGKRNKKRNNRSLAGLDLLKGLPHSDQVKLADNPDVKAWSFQDNSRDVIHVDLHKIYHKKSREFTLELIGFSRKRSISTLFGIYLKKKKLPIAEISLDILKRKLILRYQGKTSFQRVTLSFGKESVDWKILSAVINETHFTAKFGCNVEKSIKLQQRLHKIPKRAFGVLASDKYGENQFHGALFQAKLYTYAIKKDKLFCSQPASILFDETGYLGDEAINGDRILLLEQQITLLNKLVDSLKQQNADLGERIEELETCCQTDCQFDGQLFEEGDTWSPDKCTVCICRDGKPDCLQRTDISSCQAPCEINPCMNSGQCVSFDETSMDNFQCLCQPPYDGQYCDHKENPCVWPRESGICDQNLPRFYYDIDLQECLPFNYTGCGGNINNYESVEECQAVAVTGACCYRQFSRKIEDIIISSQMETFGCKEITLSECQSTHRQVVGDKEFEVISFYPGVTCDEAGCGRTEAVCMIDDRKYEVGEKAVLGCQECTCESSGQFVCSCSQKAVRKEIRDMTSQELAQFHAAIQELRLVGPDNPWEEFRDIYMRHTMHSNGGPYFLPWHRIFLRKLEQRLQQIDCSITLPYYDFTTDIGNFQDAIIWQPNFFGGDGVGGCVADHPFGPPGSWRPCISRKFKSDVKLPTLLEMSIALASDDYTEMSMCLESYVSYIHTYIGGDMATRAASYDPVFYSIHAYIDMLYWWWQNKGDNKFKYPATFANIPMVPFNIPPSAILDLESDLCVQYLWPTQGAQCNHSLDVRDNGRNPQRGDVTPDGGTFTGGFNSLGYDAAGYDRRGFDGSGFKKNGYNRDGYNKNGYDIDGYSRYGYDIDGYNRYGYDIEGWNKDNMPDLTERYNAYGLDMNCLDRRGYTTDGYDKYGFTSQGYNEQRCNYFFKGPFATIQSRRIWGVLMVQSKTFLMSLSRTCPGLEPLPFNWLQQYWITDIKDVTDMVQVGQSNSRVKNSARFCFDIDDFVSPCRCDAGIATCDNNPCLTGSCPSYPEASCRVDFCGVCKGRWYVNGKEVDCFEERDFCEPNPCENGGTCVQSIWPLEPQLTTCRCPPGFDGHYCQYTALEVCDLPLSTGSCSERETRWHFDRIKQTCQSFIYSGCTGNANNFLSKGACEARCRIGACCYRYPKNREAVIGYDLQGYDMYGFDVGGQSRRGDVRIEDNGIKTGRNRFSPDRYDWQGYDLNGLDQEGYNRWGLDKSGYDREGFNLTGYSNRGGYDGIIDYDKEGYDVEGYNRVGYTCHGSNRNGLNAYGVYTEYVYKCRSATLGQCQRLENEVTKVVRFTRSQRCDQVNCKEECGCDYNTKMYKFGETFRAGCQFCTCTYTGAVECSCPQIFRRKEIRDMTNEELQKYQDAIKKLNKMEYPSTWFQFAQIYADHKAQAVGNPASLPWHRNFLRMVEQTLQETDCSITIPYYDWTLNAGNQQKATVWAADKFGGDGSDITGCVDHHQFKDYYPPYLVPCLRRRFNMDVPLPDVIDLQMALNEPSYDKFRLHMELYFNMFKSWVGGHMDSDLSPYDPVFLSVAAFIDRIWWDWQNKHESGLLNYPQDLRYVPMMPFKLSPDYVMDSKKQMCVTYYALSEAAVCNVTLPNLNYNSLGYDRHGFDKEGYDIEGYNVYGVNRNGDADSRGIYNVNGFDRQGFKRNGYDNMGLDRFGFSEDNYNVDGYDSTGYDRSGFDRYGFDQSGKTPFGFHRNGTLLVNTVPDNFDPYGYNRYGLDKYGFDRQGYDKFGFDTFGYDRRRCNRYYLGPMLVIIKHWAEIEVEAADDKTIRIITRICPALNNLPEWIYTVNWLQRGAQVPVMEGIVGLAQQRVLSSRPEIRTSSITEDNIWLPVGPDRSLCFITYYYTECPFGQTPVVCSDNLCYERRCPGYPDAVCRVNNCGGCRHEWYNGITGNVLQCSGCIDREDIERGDGTSWATSDCEMCSCEDGLVLCVEEECAPILCTHPVKIPGQCCLQCADCEYDGVRVRNGQEFSPASNRCEVCFCNNGNVNCRYVDCPDLGTCSSQVTLEGECCPTCLDCGNRDNGESWKETPCQICACVDGRVECDRINCIPPDCSHPQIPRGECCPGCDGCTVGGQELRNGESYMPDECTECLCRDGNVVCDPLPCPLAPCLNPITPRGECCPRCDNDCKYDGRQYRHGQSFKSPEDMCINCTCDNSLVRCLPITCPRMDLPCQRPLTLPGNCCPSKCPTCFAEGREYENGERWTSLLDPCQNCVCEEGISSCTRIDRCPRECDHGIVRSGECCSDCIDCNFLGQVVRDTQVFVRPGDNCQQCTCSRGQVTCQSLGPCPRLPCRVTETPPGACCPQCKVCEYEGRTYSHGDVVYSDDCSTCHCREGEVSCEYVSCAVPNCRTPVQLPGECCPVCQECDYKGRTYEDGQRFTPLLEPCFDCVCSGGEVRCSSRESECPISRCTHPIRSRNQCCPTCEGCSYLRRRFRNGQKFVPPGNDNCKVCRCAGGSVQCSNMGCPPVNCDNAVLVKGQCCPVCPMGCNGGSVQCSSMGCPPVNCDNAVLVKGQCCPVCPMGCNVMGIEYRDGQTFIDFMDRCKVCTCMMGRIRCMAMMSCPAVTCTHPANRPGNCCPSCTMCEINSVQYRNGQIFTNPADPCEECSCSYGSVTCQRKSLSCPRVNCIDPVLDKETCCPICPAQSCVYAGRQYREGQEVPASRDQCEVCYCSQGLIDCTRRECPAVNCRHPGRDQCCNTCEYCEYNGMRFQLGEMFPSPYEQCEDCVCKAGSVECDRRVCSMPDCSSPTYLPGGCCPVCSDCTFQGLLYRDGRDFQNPSKPCERCLCVAGNVACDSRLCPKVSCRYPVLVDCCPSCTGCLYDNTQYRNGETFSSQNGCGQCQCVNGDVQCDATPVCPPVNCRHPVSRQCCQHCTDCYYKDLNIENGSQFLDPRNQCIQCACKNGTVSCDRLSCDTPTCDNPVQGTCCQECRDCNYYGQFVENNSKVQSVLNSCEECRCIMGNIVCDQKVCPLPKCSHPSRDDCCPVCYNCDFEGRIYDSLKYFESEIDPCQRCFCSLGNVTCKDTCKTDCTYLDQQYRDGETFPHSLVGCQDCVCNTGTVSCSRRQCADISCSHPIRGSCCNECTDCFYDNTEYKNKQRFRVGCQDCYCSDGNVSCRPVTCPPVTCDQPVTNGCCPECNLPSRGCNFNGRLYREGDRVPANRDPCSVCVCQEGAVSCERQQCPAIKCRHPTAGTCCPECHNCQIGLNVVQNGDMYTDVNDRCSQCKCQDGTITCEKKLCTAASCSHPEPDECECPVCGRGCHYSDQDVRNGETFHHPVDRCQECVCTAGNVQCSRKECSVSCSHAAHSDGCCQICDSCIYQGQLHMDQTSFSPLLDPCTQCMCNRGNVTCNEIQCERLDCDYPVVAPGQCCATCSGCFDVRTGRQYRDNDEWTSVDNQCVTCTCKSGNIECRATYCPSCLAGQREVTVPGQCCPRCETTPREKRCVHNGIEKQTGDLWNVNECTSCQCMNGAVKCSGTLCHALNCGSDSNPTILPGSCCPVCTPKPGTCLVYGDPHYRTFDGSTLHFQGTCRYVMASACQQEDFVVYVEHDDRGVSGVSWAQNFTITIGRITVDILQQHEVLVNGRVVVPPYSVGTDLAIERQDNNIFVNTKIGIQFIWDGSSYADLSVPGIYKNKMCGLCGNFNGYPQDDLRTKSGEITSSAAIFGNSWKAGGQRTSRCDDATDTDPCVTAGFRRRRQAASMCEVIRNESFRPCHRAVSLDPYFASCVYDLCACVNQSACLCDILSSYSRECAKAGVRLQWRSDSLCAMTCDTGSGFVFDDCGPVCHRTCDNWNTPLGDLTTNCYKPCVAGCQCPADKVVHQGKCMSIQDCPNTGT